MVLWVWYPMTLNCCPSNIYLLRNKNLQQCGFPYARSRGPKRASFQNLHGTRVAGGVRVGVWGSGADRIPVRRVDSNLRPAGPAASGLTGVSVSRADDLEVLGLLLCGQHACSRSAEIIFVFHSGCLIRVSRLQRFRGGRCKAWLSGESGRASCRCCKVPPSFLPRFTASRSISGTAPT